MTEGIVFIIAILGLIMIFVAASVAAVMSAQDEIERRRKDDE